MVLIRRGVLRTRCPSFVDLLTIVIIIMILLLLLIIIITIVRCLLK